MVNCYKAGGCGSNDYKSCNECSASKPEYMLKEKNINIYVSTLEGNVKDHYMAIGLSEEASVQNLLFAYFKDTKHTKNDLVEHGIYIMTIPFTSGKCISIY